MRAGGPIKAIPVDYAYERRKPSEILLRETGRDREPEEALDRLVMAKILIKDATRENEGRRIVRSSRRWFGNYFSKVDRIPFTFYLFTTRIYNRYIK